MAETIARQLAGFVEECDLDALPPSVVLRTKLYIMDTLGATLAGVSTASSRIVTDLVEALGGREECTVSPAYIDSHKPLQDPYSAIEPRGRVTYRPGPLAPARVKFGVAVAPWLVRGY